MLYKYRQNQERFISSSVNAVHLQSCVENGIRQQQTFMNIQKRPNTVTSTMTVVQPNLP